MGFGRTVAAKSLSDTLNERLLQSLYRPALVLSYPSAVADYLQRGASPLISERRIKRRYNAHKPAKMQEALLTGDIRGRCTLREFTGVMCEYPQRAIARRFGISRYNFEATKEATVAASCLAQNRARPSIHLRIHLLLRRSVSLARRSGARCLVITHRSTHCGDNGFTNAAATQFS